MTNVSSGANGYQNIAGASYRPGKWCAFQGYLNHRPHSFVSISPVSWKWRLSFHQLTDLVFTVVSTISELQRMPTHCNSSVIPTNARARFEWTRSSPSIQETVGLLRPSTPRLSERVMYHTERIASNGQNTKHLNGLVNNKCALWLVVPEQRNNNEIYDRCTLE